MVNAYDASKTISFFATVPTTGDTYQDVQLARRTELAAVFESNYMLTGIGGRISYGGGDTNFSKLWIRGIQLKSDGSLGTSYQFQCGDQSPGLEVQWTGERTAGGQPVIVGVGLRELDNNVHTMWVKWRIYDEGEHRLVGPMNITTVHKGGTPGFQFHPSNPEVIADVDSVHLENLVDYDRLVLTGVAVRAHSNAVRQLYLRVGKINIGALVPYSSKKAPGGQATKKKLKLRPLKPKRASSKKTHKKGEKAARNAEGPGKKQGKKKTSHQQNRRKTRR